MLKQQFKSKEEIEEALKELESRMPAHSPKAQLIAEREELEELLESFNSEEKSV